ncbi:MAG: beta-ketoacyl-ACP synthase II [Endomicrobium sp.]|jgi:3-oxoacyl-[acyl-carrier-protein] synthase II|nr:beta-ketoacyl-ACP synthase II [Endomicrobium sp.]
MKKRIVITGIGAVSPIGIGNEEFTKSLMAGKSGVTLIDTFDTRLYTTKFAASIRDFVPEKFIERKKIKRMARFTQLGFAAAKLAIDDSKIVLDRVNMSRVGVIAGIGIGGLDIIEEEEQILLLKNPNRVSPFLIPMIITNILPGEIAIEYGFTGPNYTITSACASSNNAIGDALRILRNGDADVIISGGSESAICPLGLAGFCSIRALSKQNNTPSTASRPFDKTRDGFVMGEGSGMIVLETLEHALSRGAQIYAELIGYGASNDAYHITAPDPSGASVVLAMERALNDANISCNDIDYINAHGTSTKLNDHIETLAIKKVFGKRSYKIPISSTKSMVGHLLGGAAAIELVATVIAMRDGFIPPTINYKVFDPECDLDYVPNIMRTQYINCALSNSLGFGGHNATIIIKKYNI